MPDSTYKIIELVGTSALSWEDAAKNAVETAGSTLQKYVQYLFVEVRLIP